MPDRVTLSRLLHKIKKESLNSTKSCYILDCANPPIKAHSISKSRYLKSISTNGDVLYMDLEHYDGDQLTLTPTGKLKATTFPGFCDTHDKYFALIDNNDYSIGNTEQNFLFAFRNAAREYTARSGAEKMLRDLSNDNFPDLHNYPIDKTSLQQTLVGYSVGTSQLRTMRTMLNINFSKRRYWKLNTEVLVLNQNYPIAASSVFKLEREITGKVINLVHDLTSIARPIFFTLFPQNGKTLCILSWNRTDEVYYANLRNMNTLSEKDKKVIISNLLASYVENFVVNPDYWKTLPKTTLDSFHKQWGASMHEYIVPFIHNDSLNLFV